ncbi:MAG: hypothetical protein NTV25_08205 [Methanothrix sp.]|nr:hypothetical protein [Methanothrix sp.]
MMLLAIFFALSIGSGVNITNREMDVGNISALRAALENDGFVVQEGDLSFFDVIAFYNSGLIKSCFGNNPATPYVALWLPSGPGQTGKSLLTSPRGLSVDWHLRQDEAVIYIGRTPPNCSYFSYRSYVFDKFYPQEGKYKRIFGDLGDALNQRSLKSEGSQNGSSRDPFNQTTLIISTADWGIDERVRTAAKSAGYPSSIINTDVIPSALVTMGLDNKSDTFAFILRLAFFQDPMAGSAFVKDPPGEVFRVTPKKPAKLDPYRLPNLIVRGTGNASELDLTPALDELRSAILAKYGNLRANELKTSVWFLTPLQGYDGIQRGVNVYGPNRDAFYLNTTSFTLADDPEEFLIVYGVNHAATGKAIYSNFALYGADILNGVGCVNSQNLSGTAEEYLPDNPKSKYLYVWKVARHCHGDPHCLEIPWGVKAYGIELTQSAYVAFRGYLEKNMTVGSNYDEILYDRAIKFGPAK